MLVKVTAFNRGPADAEIHLLPTILFRNTWAWDADANGANGNGAATVRRPQLHRADGPAGTGRGVRVEHPQLGVWQASCDGEPELLFTENETNNERLFHSPNRTPFVKDGINNYIVNGNSHAVNPAGVGTKCAACYKLNVPAGGEKSVRLRMRFVQGAVAGGAGNAASASAAPQAAPFGREFDETFAKRRREADEFYAAIIPKNSTPDEALVIRQALAGMLWTKQLYLFDINNYLTERGVDPMASRTMSVRNRDWFHMANGHVISLPDKWEYRGMPHGTGLSTKVLARRTRLEKTDRLM